MEGNEPQGTNPTEVTPGAENNQNPSQVQLPGWTAGLPAELKEQYGSKLGSYAKIGDFAAQAFSAMDKLERAVVRPGEGATEDEVAAYREAMGIPADSNGYELNAEGNGVEGFIEGLRNLAFEKQWPKDTAADVMDFYIQQDKAATEALKTELVNQRENTLATLQKELGSNFQGDMTRANRMISSMFGEGFVDSMNENLLGNNLEFVRGMINISKLISEDAYDHPERAGGPTRQKGVYSFKNTPGME